MKTKKIVMILGIMTAFVSTAAIADLEAQYKPLLKEYNRVMCTIQDHGASNKAKGYAQRDMGTIQNKLNSIEIKMSPATRMKYMQAKGKATTDCKVARVSASEYKPLLKALRKNMCTILNSYDNGNSAAAAKAGLDNDRIKKELEPMARSLKLNDKKAYARFRKTRSQAISGTNCFKQ